MLSEEFDKKIREAAQHHHPAYDERAWAGMKKQLDKHMPVEDDRRRRGLFFLLIFLLLGGAVALYQWGPFAKKDKSTPASVLANRQQPANSEPPSEKNQSVPAPANSENTASTVLNEAPSAITNDNQIDKDAGTSQQELNKPAAERQVRPDAIKQNPVKDNPSFITQTATRGSKQKSRPVNSRQQSGIKQQSANVAAKSINKQPGTVQPENLPPPPAAETVASIPAGEQKSTTNSAVPPSKPLTSNQPKSEENKNNPDQAKESAVAKETIPQKEKESKPKMLARKKSNFFFAVSAGPDVSFTSGDELGRMKMVGGFGLGYTFRGRITLRTGIYSGKKIYTASPANYKGSPQFYQYYPNLQKIDADCQVQEIPLNISYHFGNKNNRPFFVSAGVSSLIMKEETYNYFYKYSATSPVINRSYSTYNQNRHFFSQLNLSAGYQLALGKRFSVIAEPYLKLPMGGVGNGKVRLNSTGIMFTITANPFGKFQSPKSK